VKYVQRTKRLRLGLAYGNVVDLPEFSTGPRGSGDQVYRAIAEAGYEAVQGGNPELCRAHGLEFIDIGIIPTPTDAEPFAAKARQQGALAATCIVGYGYESDEEIDRLCTEILRVARSYELPIYIETHRGSITQDAWRTAQLVQRMPEIRFNGDFSHWFTGQEMPYGDFGLRLRHLAPVIERVRFLHGRIGDRCCLQVDIGDGSNHPSVPYFRQFWIAAMQSFIATSDPQHDLWFCPELLGPEFAYARTFSSPQAALREESDRWAQAQVLAALARQCFTEAERALPCAAPRRNHPDSRNLPNSFRLNFCHPQSTLPSF
jgi:hypothetical protein